MLRASFTCALLAASVSVAQVTLSGYAKGADKTEQTVQGTTTVKRDKYVLERADSDSPCSSAFSSFISPRNSTDDYVSLEGGSVHNKAALLEGGETPSPQKISDPNARLPRLEQRLGDEVAGREAPNSVDSVQNTAQHATQPVMPTNRIGNSPPSETIGTVDVHNSRTHVANVLRRTHRQDIMCSGSSSTDKGSEDLNRARLPRKAGKGIAEYHIDSLSDGMDEALPIVDPDCKILRKTASAERVTDAPRAGNRFKEGVSALSSADMNMLNVGEEVSRPDENAEQSFPAKKGETEARASEATDMFHAPVRRLTPLLPAWGAAKQHVDRKTRKDEETFQAFEKGVAQLRSDTMNELAQVLGTRDRPLDLPLLEKVVEKVGLDGLGGPCPRGFSMKERGVMAQAKRYRQQVDRVKSKYERGTRYLTEELRDWLQLSNAYRQRISDVVNNGMYTSAAQLFV